MFKAELLVGSCTNQIKSQHNKFKCRLLVEPENRRTRGKTSWNRAENQQTQSTYESGSGNQTRDTLEEGECSHHVANPAPLILSNSVDEMVHLVIYWIQKTKTIQVFFEKITVSGDFHFSLPLITMIWTCTETDHREATH